MSKVYTINITNKTGIPQDYIISSSPPVVSGGNAVQIWGNVLKSIIGLPHGAVIEHKVGTNYSAICGTFLDDQKSGGRVSMDKSVPVILGAAIGSDVNNGSSVEFKVSGDGMPGDLGMSTYPGKCCHLEPILFSSFVLRTLLGPKNSF